MTENVQRGAKRYPVALTVTIGLFALWGLAHRLHGIISPEFRAFFAYDHVQAALAFSSAGLSYCVVAIPAALFLRRFGYKLGLVSGLSAFSIGAFLLYPAVARHDDLFYVAAIIIIGAGWAFLETSANPLIVQMGPPETAIRRLNLAQTLYPVGLVLGVYLAPLITPPSVPVQDLEVLVRPYVIIGLSVLLLAFLVEYIEYPRVASERTAAGISVREEIRALWSTPLFRLGLVTLATFMLGLVCLWGITSRYAHQVLPAVSKATVAELSLSTWILCGIGRATGTALMYRFDPNRVLVVFASAAVALSLAAAVSLSQAGLVCLIGASFFISIMFPTIFANAIQGLGASTKIASGLLVTAAGFGVSAGNLAMTAVARHSGLQTALIVAGLCFAGVLAYARLHCGTSLSGTGRAPACDGRARQR